MYENMSAADMQTEAARIAGISIEASYLHNKLRDTQNELITKLLEDGLSKELANSKSYDMMSAEHSDEIDAHRAIVAEINAWEIFSTGVVVAGWKSNLETNERMASIYERQ